MANLRPDYARVQHQRDDSRSPDRLIAHYELERRLADRLRNASPEDRPSVYMQVYAEMFAALPDHPMQRAVDRDQTSTNTARRCRVVRRLLKPESTYLEVGCGDASLPFAVAPYAGEVIGLDVTDSLIDHEAAPSNFRFLLARADKIDLPDNSVDLAHSDQLMEHLHVDDAAAQVREIHRVLKPGGCYLCITPSRVTGPHDISVYFDKEATGFHMREYDYASIRQIFLATGFREIRFPIVVKGNWLTNAPYAFLRSLELALLGLPKRLRETRIVGTVMGIRALAIK